MRAIGDKLAMSTITKHDLDLLDASDTLRSFRDQFTLPQGVIYLDGNSLGAMPKATPERVRQVVEHEWGQDLIRSWNMHGWVDMQQRVGAKVGRLIGAREGETIVADSTSVNLFKALAAGMMLRPDRTLIVSEKDNFPTDVYIAEGVIRHSGGHHELRLLDTDEIEDAITPEVAVLMLTHVNYRTGRMYDMKRITAKAHAAGAVVVWDLAHSAGAVPLDLAGAQADLAVGCGYKYLNGGPGAPAFLYMATEHHGKTTPPLSGWFGHAAPFAFERSYRPAAGITQGAVGTPPIISLAALEVGVDLILGAPMDELRKKSVQQTELFAALVAQELRTHGFELVSPIDSERRGSQVCFRHPNAWPITQALIARGVIGDFRAPDVLRFGFAPLYVGYAELWEAVATLREIMDERAWDRPEYRAKMAVT